MARWTPETGHEMGKRFAKWEPLPDFIEVTGPYMYADGNDGLRIRRKLGALNRPPGFKVSRSPGFKEDNRYQLKAHDKLSAKSRVGEFLR